MATVTAFVDDVQNRKYKTLGTNTTNSAELLDGLKYVLLLSKVSYGNHGKFGGFSLAPIKRVMFDKYHLLFPALCAVSLLSANVRCSFDRVLH